MKQKREVVVLIILVVIAVLVWTYEWRSPSPTTLTATQIENIKVLGVEDQAIRWGEVGRAQETEYKSNGRNPFSVIVPPTPQEVRDRANAEAPKPIVPQTPIEPPKPTVAVPPADLKYFGYAQMPVGSTRRAFFVEGDDIYVVREGDTLLGRYRILRVGNVNLEFEEISSGLHGTMPLEEQAAPSSAGN